ncbi:MAG: glycoside hydrolase family 31 protein [Candidatus Cryptobacteroides sp.]|nr:glycoside hydrolase family 31 protein [Candidatus Cryptobacteroides sp.]
MKKILLAVACCAMTLLAQANPTHKVKINDGLTVSVEACSESIFRIKVSPRKDFTESLMERYELIKTDWSEVKTDISDKGGVWTLKTPEYSLAINKKTGVMTVKDAKGGKVIREVRFLPEKEGLCGEMRSFINEKYADLKVADNGGGIIGDDNGKFGEVDKHEIPAADAVSILSFSMEDGERFYGGGSTSRDHIQHRGEFLRMWTTYQQTEIPMPFMMSSRGWGVYNNSTRKSFFDIGNQQKTKFNIINTFDEADFFLMMGKDMPAILNEYTLVTGRTYVLPKWAYGLCFGPNMREEQFDILNDAVRFRQFDVPCDVFWLEPQWMEKRYDFSTKKKWNYDRFSPEPYWLQDQYPKTMHNRLFIGKLRSMGFHLGLWLCEEYDLSIQEEDIIAERTGGKLSGQEHWMDHLTVFMDQGVEGFKLDPARTIDNHTNWEYYNGRTDKEMHNLNQVLLPKQMRELGRKYNGKRTWHHYCGGWSGTQHWTASTSGDNGGGKTALYDQLNLGMSGFLNTSCDVMSVPRELEMQGLHFGLFLPWVQINSWFSMMHPFYYAKEEQDIYRFYVKLRYSLAPYIYSMALEAAQNGMPIVRSMPLCFPDDRNCDDMTYQYMFGDNFCVGIFTNEIYLPKGTWTDAWSGEKIVSKGETFTREYPSNRAGLLFIREGAIIPTQPDVEYLGARPFDRVILKVYPHGDSAYTMLDDDGESYEYENGGIASTLFESHERDGGVEVVVNPVQGSFKGMPSEREYSFRIQRDSRPASVSLNGAAVQDWTYEDGMICLSAGKVGVGEKVVVSVR